MKRTRRARSGDFARLAQDFRSLDANDPGLWPLAPRIAVLAAVLAATLAGYWWFDWRDQVRELERARAGETVLRQTWLEKKRQAANLDEHRQQLAEIDRQFGALLKQLPGQFF